MADRRLKVLIVDDEHKIGILIKTLIEWDQLNLECIGTVNNGEKAFEIISEQEPDIVLTDIQMPRINGLDLIALTKEKNENIKYIVISGHKDFDYAHKALQYGVKNYLLKPVNATELNKNIKEISIALMDEYSKKKKVETYEKEIHASQKIIKKDILKNILEEEEMLTREKILKTHKVNLSGPVFLVFDIKLDYWDFEKIDKKQDHITADKIIDIVETAFEDEAEEQFIYEKESLHIYCLFNYGTEKSKSINDTINKVLIEIQEYLLGFEQYEVTIGIGGEKTQFEDIAISAREAIRAVGNRIKMGTGRLIYAETLPFKKESYITDYLRDFDDQLLTSINSFSTEKFKICINQIFDKISKDENIDYSCYYDLTKQLIDLFYDKIEVENENGAQLKQHLLEVYQHIYSIAKLKNLLVKYLSEYLEECQRIVEMESIKPIRQAKQYIDEHFSEKIVLEDISKIIGLNPVYFSVLFKKETGLNFSAFLVKVRIENAKKMLKNSNETIAAVADRVGYKDVRYFSRLFTKTVGLKPALYRRLYS